MTPWKVLHCCLGTWCSGQIAIYASPCCSFQAACCTAGYHAVVLPPLQGGAHLKTPQRSDICARRQQHVRQHEQMPIVLCKICCMSHLIVGWVSKAMPVLTEALSR